MNLHSYSEMEEIVSLDLDALVVEELESRLEMVDAGGCCCCCCCCCCGGGGAME